MRANRILTVVCIISLALASIFAVLLFRANRPGQAAAAPTQPGQNKQKILYWWDPMLGPSSISDKPGISAMGMKLVPVYAGAESAGSGITIDPAVVQNMGVQTAEVVRGPLTKTIRAVGLVMMPEPGMHEVSLKVGGWIDKLYADQNGMHVMAGEVLFDVYSPALQVAEQELISAVKARKSLPADTSPEVRRDTQSLIDSARQKLRLWGVAEQDIDAIAKAKVPPRDVPFRAPAMGHLEDKAVVQGSAFAAMTPLMRIVDHTKVWLDAQVYQDDVPLMKLGQEMVATTDGTPGRIWKGKIDLIYPHIDATSRTLTVRTTLSTPHLSLKPGMYANVKIITQPITDAVLVPRQAVIDTGTRQLVFLALGHGHFSAQSVQMGIEGNDGLVQVLKGLTPGQTVVTSGQFLMDVESNTNEAIAKMREPATQPVGMHGMHRMHEMHHGGHQ